MSIGHQTADTGSVQGVPSLAATRGNPPWEVATLFPLQGEWTEEDYLELESSTKRMIELVDGCLEVLPMPTNAHQFILRFLFRVFDSFVVAHELGEVLFAPLPVRFDKKNYREPDLIYFRKGRELTPSGYPQTADLAIEIVSDGPRDRKRDFEDKRIEYARRGIEEYWIVDPKLSEVSVLRLEGGEYREFGKFVPGENASSVLLKGLAVNVQELFEAGKGR